MPENNSHSLKTCEKCGHDVVEWLYCPHCKKTVCIDCYKGEPTCPGCRDEGEEAGKAPKPELPPYKLWEDCLAALALEEKADKVAAKEAQVEEKAGKAPEEEAKDIYRRPPKCALCGAQKSNKETWITVTISDPRTRDEGPTVWRVCRRCERDLKSEGPAPKETSAQPQLVCNWCGADFTGMDPKEIEKHLNQHHTSELLNKEADKMAAEYVMGCNFNKINEETKKPDFLDWRWRAEHKPRRFFAGDYQSIEKDLVELINKQSRENRSNTPDFILAQFMARCLKAAEDAVNARDSFYGLHPEPGMRPANTVGSVVEKTFKISWDFRFCGAPITLSRLITAQNEGDALQEASKWKGWKGSWDAMVKEGRIRCTVATEEDILLEHQASTLHFYDAEGNQYDGAVDKVEEAPEGPQRMRQVATDITKDLVRKMNEKIEWPCHCIVCGKVITRPQVIEATRKGIRGFGAERPNPNRDTVIVKCKMCGTRLGITTESTKIYSIEVNPAAERYCLRDGNGSIQIRFASFEESEEWMTKNKYKPVMHYPKGGMYQIEVGVGGTDNCIIFDIGPEGSTATDLLKAAADTLRKFGMKATMKPLVHGQTYPLVLDQSVVDEALKAFEEKK